MTPCITETAKTVLERRYYLKNKNNKIIEDWKILCRRVANAVASVDSDNKDYENIKKSFFEIIYNLDFLPNSPCLMNAGTDMQMLSACFVLPIDDSMESIFESVKNGALVNKWGGGTGYSFSRIRGKNSSVRSTNGVASGPISFAKVFDVATDVIKQGGRRRGANMGVLRVDHPDIMDFISAKEKDGELSNFNFSVAITDTFMEAVKSDSDYNLIDPTNKEVIGSLSARNIFDEIVKRAWKNGEPGVLFIDAANRANPTPHLGEFETTNPCVTGDTEILTKEYGYKKIKDTVEKSVSIWNGEEWSPVLPRKTGENISVTKVTFSSGDHLLCTDYHGFYLRNNKRVECKDLKIGDKLTRCSWPVIDNNNAKDVKRVYAYTAGFFSGDGHIQKSSGRRQIFLYDKKIDLIDEFDYSHKWICSGNRVAIQLSTDNYDKNFVPGVEWSMQSRLCWLAGIIDSDGAVNDQGGSLNISSINKEFIIKINRLLNTLGTSGTVSIMKKAENKIMPDGKGGKKKYSCQESYRIVISASAVKSLRELGLNTKRVDISIANPNRSCRRFISVKSIERDHHVAKKVFCFDEKKKHSAIFNGVITAQCGEQFLLPYEACNLGSINLGRYVVDKKVDFDRLGETVKTAVRFLDNVVDCNEFPIKEIEEMTKKTRKIGLGIMGLHDMLIKLEIPYDSSNGRKIASDVMKYINTVSRTISFKLGEEKGGYPEQGRNLPKDSPRPALLRNAARTSIQPTGTVSMIADCGSGCEPYFAIVTEKHVMDGDKLLLVNKHFELIAKKEGFFSDDLMKKIAKSGTVIGHEEIPEKWQKIFKTSQDIQPEDHIKMQGALQKHVCSSISKTINMSYSATVDDVKRAYLLGWKFGCKGLTVYRDGSRENQVLNVGKNEKRLLVNKKGMVKKELPDEINAKRYKLHGKDGESVYIIVCFDERENPVEVFAKFPYENRQDLSEKSTMWTTACRLASLLLRYGTPIEEIIKQLDRSSGNMFDLPAQLGKLLKGFMASTTNGYSEPCPDCEDGVLIYESGCAVCKECGWSKCA